MCALSRKGRGVRAYRKLALVAYLFQELISKKGVCPFREKSFEGLQAYCCLVVVRRLVHDVFSSGGKIAARGAAVSGLQPFFSFCCLVAELEARSLCEASRDLGSYARSFELLSPAVAPQRQACGMPSRLAAYHAFSYVRTEKGGIGGNYKSLMIVLGHVALWGCLLRSLQ